jgi:hypothetical protein
LKLPSYFEVTIGHWQVLDPVALSFILQCSSSLVLVSLVGTSTIWREHQGEAAEYSKEMIAVLHMGRLRR